MTPVAAIKLPRKFTRSIPPRFISGRYYLQSQLAVVWWCQAEIAQIPCSSALNACRQYDVLLMVWAMRAPPGSFFAASVQIQNLRTSGTRSFSVPWSAGGPPECSTAAFEACYR